MGAMRSRLSKRQLAYLHTLKSVNRLSEVDYRELLREGAGVASAKELDSAGLDRVLSLMEQLGLDVGTRQRTASSYGRRPGMATPKQLQYIEDLAAAVFGADRETAFGHWLERYFKVSHARFLTRVTAQHVIEALKGMRERGYTGTGGKA